ncbi:hypothetical protein SLS55_001583 [Diplodia seriata]|uniref:Uncharacterized protein n=1 Tax=Diplodia seriata TaxID=420778 RepID=A0A0G2GI70_9PEZI|nr:hypothetical protein UCDDS831_g06852 [Diplodia seriata]
MAFYFDDLLTAGDAEQALRYKFSPVDIRPNSATSESTASSSSKNSTAPCLRSSSNRQKLVKNSARYSTPIACATWPCKTPRVEEMRRSQFQSQYYAHRMGYSYLNL